MIIPQSEQYPFVSRDPAAGNTMLFPYLPFGLEKRGHRIDTRGLLDTAAAVNVLPWNVGLQLGFDWDREITAVRLTGNLAAVEARGVVAQATVGRFPPVRLAFAWCKVDEIPLLLGQMNFFLEFDVYLSRAAGVFEVKPR
jgi:hypothetical protein